MNQFFLFFSCFVLFRFFLILWNNNNGRHKNMVNRTKSNFFILVEKKVFFSFWNRKKIQTHLTDNLSVLFSCFGVQQEKTITFSHSPSVLKKKKYAFFSTLIKFCVCLWWIDRSFFIIQKKKKKFHSLSRWLYIWLLFSLSVYLFRTCRSIVFFLNSVNQKSKHWHIQAEKKVWPIESTIRFFFLSHSMFPKKKKKNFWWKIIGIWP